MLNPNAKLIASVSGGKDSTAMCLHLREQSLPYEAVFFDTGWEHRKTYDHLDYLDAHIGPIKRLRAEVDLSAKPRLEELAQGFERRLGHYSAMVRVILWKGMFPSRRRRFCTQELKVFVARDYLRSFDEEVVNVVGIRAAESEARSKLGEREQNETFDCEVWRPLIAWSEQDVIDIHARHGVLPNPLYLEGASRVGCWPCIMARKSEIKLIADKDLERIAVLEGLEAAVGELAWERHVSRGGTEEWIELVPARDQWGGPNESDDDSGDDAEPLHGPIRHVEVTRRWNAPSWFQAPIKDDNGDSPGWPILKVVEWSRTAHGGRQFELFAPQGEEGCVRWGLCETPKPEAG